MTLKEIRKHMIDLDLSDADIAARLSQRQGPVTRQMVNLVMNGKKKTAWIRREIAKELELAYEMLWGEADPGGDRLHAASVPARGQEGEE